MIYQLLHQQIEITAAVYEYSQQMEVSGTGRLSVINTGGSSAGDGGMGSGSKDDREKGDLSEPGEKGGTAAEEEEEEGFDPIKKNVKEKEGANDNSN